jgi:glycerol uptake facilitator-like aquaporin
MVSMALKYVAEFLGTFFFLVSILMSGGNAFIIGGILAIVILLIGGISGGMVNPAVAYAMFARGSIAFGEFLAYAFVQILAAAFAVYAYQTLA